MDTGLLGRDDILDTLGRLALDGNTVLVYGPLGIGKTVVLSELARRMERAGRPCAYCPRTLRLSDITEALARGYSTGSGACTQRQRRSRLRLAVGQQPGILILDHLLDAGSAVKGYLRSLRGTGLGVVIAADVDHPRDHARIRAMHLAYRELAIPPLPDRLMRRLLDREMESIRSANLISESDRRAIIQLAAGRPGWLARLAAAASQPSYWQRDRLCIELLAADISIAVMRHYAMGLDEHWSRR